LQGSGASFCTAKIVKSLKENGFAGDGLMHAAQNRTWRRKGLDLHSAAGTMRNVRFDRRMKLCFIAKVRN
jgi:hypothetical protein